MQHSEAPACTVMQKGNPGTRKRLYMMVESMENLRAHQPLNRSLSLSKRLRKASVV